MQAVTRNSLRDLDFRMGVSNKVLGLLSRAHGLDLLRPDEGAEEVTELRNPREPLGLGESNQGIDFGDGTAAGIRRVVLVVQKVNYPQPGWAHRKQWEAEDTCRNLGDKDECAFPLACACYG